MVLDLHHLGLIVSILYILFILCALYLAYVGDISICAQTGTVLFDLRNALYVVSKVCFCGLWWSLIRSECLMKRGYLDTLLVTHACG